MNHDRERIVGHGTATIENNSIALDGKLSAVNDDTKRITDLAAEGFPWQASIGLNPSRLEQVEAGSSVTVNGQLVQGPATIVRAGKLFEVSVVAIGADDTTSTTVAATHSQSKGLTMGFSAWLSSQGFVEASLSEGQLATLKLAYEASQKPPADRKPTSTIDEVLLQAKAREERQAEYARIIASAIDRGLDSETASRLVAAATADNLPSKEFELEVLRLGRHIGSSGRAPSGGNDSPELIEAAMARATGDKALLATFKPEVLEASESRYKHGLSVVEFLVMAARRNGHHDISTRDVKGLLKAAFAPTPIQAKGASTYDVGGVLSNVANKAVRAGFEAVEDSWRKIVAIKPVNDLKEHTTYSLTGDFTYKKVGKGGELSHAELGELSYGNKAETYGRIFSLTRSDILNDDLSALGRVRTLLGRGCALAMAKVVWTEFLSDPAFWSVARKNLLTGAGSALDVDSLSKAVTTFESQTDPQGEPLGLTPSILLVGSPLKIQAERLVTDPEIRIAGATAREAYTTKNPHSGKYEVVSSQYLSNAKIPNSTNTGFWLLADPMDMPVLELAALFGRLEPTIESAEADFDILGIQMRGVSDFGARLQEFRGSVFSAGV